jgi:cell division septum initiation protein DivIVA
LTADRVRRWAFDVAPVMRRGYEPQAVEVFRTQVARELELMATQVAYLRAENERLTERVEMHRHGVIPSNQETTPHSDDVHLLSAAQREAEQIVTRAHDYAHRMAEHARAQYDSQLRAAAEQARAEAEQIVRERTVAAEHNPQEALRIYGQLMQHMEVAARHLHDVSEHLARAVRRPAGGDRPALPGQ